MQGRVLIVDDDHDICGLLTTALSTSGLAVEARFDGESALAAFRENAFDVVVTDVRMPGMDGLEVLRALKSIDPDVGVIVYSAALEDRTRLAIDALRGGAADYFIKPLPELSELERAVAVAVGNRRARREQAGRVRELEQRVRTDPLTGLGNRIELDQRLLEEFSRLGRGVEEFAIAMFDVDHFKTINDTHGHLLGDDVLRSVAHALRESCRAYDIKARYGGDEFIVVMPDTHLDQGVAVAEKIRRAVAALAFPVNGTSLRLTLSAGVTSTIAREGITPAGLIQRADLALYEAKNTGRNRTVPRAQAGPAAEVLIVGADAGEAAALLAMVENLGFRGEWVRTGAEAVARAHQARHILALVDLLLPDGQGTEAIGRIREASPVTNAALMTGADPENARLLEALDRSPVTLVRKPLSLDHLRALLPDSHRRN